MDEEIKNKKGTKGKPCKIGGLWIDSKQYPLLAQMETQEQLNRENESESRPEDGKRKTKK